MIVRATRRSGLANELSARQHTLASDEPVERGGTDTAPMPSELLALSLASCTATTIEMYADRKGWAVDPLEVEVDYELAPSEGHARFDVTIKLPGALSEKQAEQIAVIAGKCPVHRILLGKVEITDRVERV